MEVVMKRILYLLFVALALSVIASPSYAQVPSLEGQITLPAIVNGASSVVSDGYGQHFIVIDPSTAQIKHYLVGNDGIELSAYRGTVSTSGTFPVLTAYQGKLRTTFNIGTQIYVYQSANGGVDWSQVGTPYPFAAGSIYNIDAYTDGYGTHIVWQDRDDFSSEPEVYYVRWDDRIPNWADYKNVSDLAGIPGQWGAKPKVVASASEAHIVYPHLGGSSLVSRDLNLSNGQWDANYATSENVVGVSLSTAVIGNILYAIVNGATIAQQNPAMPYREIYFAYRNVNSSTWADYGYLAGSHLNIAYNEKNLIAAGDPSDLRLYFLNACYPDDFFDCNVGEYGVYIRRYTPGSGWETPEFLGQTNANDFVQLSTNQFGVFSVWGDVESSSAKYARRKPFAIAQDITANTLLSGNNWIAANIAIPSGVSVTVLPLSETLTFANYGIAVANGATLTMNAGSRFKFEQNAWMDIYGKISVNGTSSQRVTFIGTSADPNYRWDGLYINCSRQASTLSFTDIAHAKTAVFATNSYLDLNNTTVSFSGDGFFIIDGHWKYNRYAVTSCTISNCSPTLGLSNGLYVFNGNNVVANDNKIENNGTGVIGMSLSGGSPLLHKNWILNNGWVGVVIDQGSTARFGDHIWGDEGRNRIENNAGAEIGVHGAAPFFGYSEDDPEYAQGGKNSIVTGNDPYALINAQAGSGVVARSNWWGTCPPDASRFLISGGSWIDYKNYLCAPPLGPVQLKGHGGLLTSNPPPSLYSLTPEEEMLERALRFRGDRNYLQAIATYASLIAAKPNSAEAQTALYHLPGTYMQQPSWQADSTLPRSLDRYLRGQMSSHPNSTIKRIAWQLWAALAEARGYSSSALAEYRNLLQSGRTDDEMKSALFNLVRVNAVNFHNLSAARQDLAQLEQQFPGDQTTLYANRIVQRVSRSPFRSGLLRELSEDGGSLAESGPTGFALAQNYPNPFNPTTNIRFQIPDDGLVSLKVYNVLGQEVATLVDEVRTAGTYTEAFDASRLASGVYIYKLTAGVHSTSKKLVLIR